MKKEMLLGKTQEELKLVAENLDLPKFVARQMSDWLYKKNVNDIDEMTNISLKARALLKEKFDFGTSNPVKVQSSVDGTKKYLYETSKTQKFIEAAYIPDNNRHTLCVSSQIGCKMACTFCMTGKQGFQGQLSSGEIINQIRSLPEKDQLSNIVYMGMGEPLDNLEEVMKSLEILTSDYGMAMSPRRITLSTIGMIPEIHEFLNCSKCHLALSLHSPFDDEREKLMPIQKTHPMKKLLDIIRGFDFDGQRRVSFEYIVFKGINDSRKHVKELCKLLNGIKCRINLIRFHAIPNTPLVGLDDKDMEVFRDQLNEKGIVATVRKSRGLDICAACGLLSTKNA